MSPQIKNSALGLYKCFKVSSSVLINCLKSLIDALYKLHIIYVDDLFSISLMAQISKSFSLQLCEILILLK
jgi:hypothetical protein